MVNSEIRLIIFFATKDGEALYSQQKQDQELTVAQTMNSLLSNSDLKKVGKTTRPFKYDLNQILTKINLIFSKEDFSHLAGFQYLKGLPFLKYNSDDHYIYNCGQQSLRRNGVAIMVNKRNAV